MKGYVYKITNKINEKSYVGQTTQSLKKRFGDHFRDTSHCAYLKGSIKKYGKENFTMECLEIVEAESNQELRTRLNDLEVKYIKENNTLCPNGYNLTSGGNAAVICGESIKKRAEKFKKTIICNETGRVYPSTVDAAKEFAVLPKFISRVLRGKRKHFRGLSFSYYAENGQHRGKSVPREIEENRNISFTGKKRSAEATATMAKKFSKPIICNETGSKYPSVAQASIAMNLPRPGISKVLTGYRKSYKGFTFSYLPKQS